MRIVTSARGKEGEREIGTERNVDGEKERGREKMLRNMFRSSDSGANCKQYIVDYGFIHRQRNLNNSLK